MSISRFNKLGLIALCLITFLACEFDGSNDDSSFHILSPRSDWVYYDDSIITFSMDVDSGGIEWLSSLTGKIGTGNALVSYLGAGVHKITARLGESTRSVTVTVYPREYSSLDEKGILLNSSLLTCVIPPFLCYPYVVTCDDKVDSLTLSVQDESKQEINTTEAVSLKTQTLRRDVGIRTVTPAEPVVSARAAISMNSVIYAKGDTRMFRVIDTKNQLGEPHLLSATAVFVSDKVLVWVVNESIVEETQLTDFCERLEGQILPRVRALWGEWADIDNDGKISIVLSPTINSEGIATGFFNPCDFFSYNADPSSPDFNPASNEMDVVYLALPEEDPSSSYSVPVILATAAHEMTHAVTYTQKTWKPLLTGNKGACQEELFLDEGWSHLSETLCGYGVSGGNIRFLEVFLENTHEYSFCGTSASGQDDSAGRRGAMAMFLSWLFWQKGGMTWDTRNPVVPVDAGGISFLKSMVASPETGWESIGLAYGTSTRALFRDFVSAVNRCRLVDYGSADRIDPITGEPVYLFTNMGTVTYNTSTLEIGNPCSLDCFSGSSANLVAWSFQILDPFDNKMRSVLSITQTSVPSDVWLQILLY